MKIQPNPTAGERGAAIVVVLAVLLLILAFMAGNNVTLRSLHREVQLIEKRQLRRYELSDAGSGTAGRAKPVASDAAAPAASRMRPEVTNSQPN